MTSNFTLRIIIATVLTLISQLQAKPWQGSIDSLSGDSMGALSERSVDSLGGGNLIRGLESLGGSVALKDLGYLMDKNSPRAIDSLGSGHLIRNLDSIGGSHLIRNLDSIGGGNLIRHAPTMLLPPEVAAELQALYANSVSDVSPEYRLSKRLDTLGGISLGYQKRNFDEINRQAFNSFNKRNLDEIGRSAFGGFAKRNLDEIDRSSFGGFAKRNLDEIDRSSFGGFAKRNLDEINRSGFGSFAKRNLDEINRAGFDGFAKKNSVEKRSAGSSEALTSHSNTSPSNDTSVNKEGKHD